MSRVCVSVCVSVRVAIRLLLPLCVQLRLPERRGRPAQRGQQQQRGERSRASLHPAGDRRGELEQQVPQDGAEVQDRLRPEGLEKTNGRREKNVLVPSLSRASSAGIPGGAGAPARVAAEERGDGEQVSEGQGGGADGAGPAGEEGAGGRRAGAAGATVSWFFCFVFLEWPQRHDIQI